MKAIIAIVCIFTPVLGWIALVFFMDAWQKEDAMREQLKELQQEPRTTSKGESVSDGVLTGVLIILMSLGGLFLLLAMAE